MGITESRRSRLVDEVDALPAQHVGHALVLVGVAGHPFGVGQHRGDVDLGRLAAQAERVPGPGVAHETGGAGQGADRRRALVDAGTADLSGLDQGHRGAEFPGVQRGTHAGRTGTHHE